MDIKGYEDYYTISEDGKVWSKRRDKYITGGKRSIGYLTVDLCKDGKRKTHSIHRLVALHYIENPEDKPEVDHKDRNVINNSVSNLRWVTKSEQNRNKKAYSNTGYKYISIKKGNEYYEVSKDKVFRYSLRRDKWTLEEAVEIRDCLCIRHEIPVLEWID